MTKNQKCKEFLRQDKMYCKFILLFWFVLHPVHITLTSVYYVPEDDSLNVLVKVYLDDFLLDMKHDEGTFAEDSIKSKELTENYINRKLIIEANRKTLTGKINRFEMINNEVKIYMEYKTLEKPQEVLVRNLIMTDLYSDQNNFMIIKIDKFEEGVKFTPDITERVFKIEELE